MLAAMSRKNSNQKPSASTVENTNAASAKGTEMKNRKPITITESKGLPSANFDLRLIRIEKEVVELTKKNVERQFYVFLILMYQIGRAHV